MRAKVHGWGSSTRSHPSYPGPIIIREGGAVACGPVPSTQAPTIIRPYKNCMLLQKAWIQREQYG